MKARLTEVMVAAGAGVPPAGMPDVDLRVWRSCMLQFFTVDDRVDDDAGYPSAVAVNVLCVRRTPWHRLRHRWFE